MDRWSWYWSIWFTVAFTAFAVPELYAIFTGHHEHKLSEHFWGLQDLLPAPTVWRVLMFLFMTYLAFHLTFGPRH